MGFDPTIVDVFLAKLRAGTVWERIAEPDLLRVVSRLEPADRVLAVTPERLDLTARAFARIIDAKPPFAYRHSERIAETAAAMAKYMGLPAPVVRDQARAGLLHDIGKLGVSNRILDKPGPLADEEFAKVKRHPGLTHEVLTRVAPFRAIAEVAASHHERLDGTGYHRGVGAGGLSLPARVLAVADVFDALSQERPYRPALPTEKVLDTERGERRETLSPLRGHPQRVGVEGRSLRSSSGTLSRAEEAADRDPAGAATPA